MVSQSRRLFSKDIFDYMMSGCVLKAQLGARALPFGFNDLSKRGLFFFMLSLSPTRMSAQLTHFHERSIASIYIEQHCPPSMATYCAFVRLSFARPRVGHIRRSRRSIPYSNFQTVYKTRNMIIEPRDGKLRKTIVLR